MKIVPEITADEAHKLHEADLNAWLIALRDHPLETLAHIPPTVLRFIRQMGYIDGNSNVLSPSGIAILED